LFSGNHTGEFAAYDARTGEKLWAAPTQAKVVAAPSTYTIDGEQYVAVLVGARALPNGVDRTNPTSANNSRILVYKQGGTAHLPTKVVNIVSTTSRTLNPPLLTGTNEQVLDGQGVYARTCAVCHGADAIADKTAPDLRYTTLLNSQRDWDDVVIRGSRATNGMASFKNQLADQDSENLRQYIISRANQDKAAEQARAR
jgi:alcohol dehydrogenase (cytochrome c)/quinohemoprotein ethanol dehydrogenase